MLHKYFNVLFLANLLIISFNLYCSESMQMEVGGAFYALSYQRTQEGNHAFKPEISEGKLVFFDESDENGGIAIQFFDKRNPEITGNADGISIFMENREGRKIFSNNPTDQKEISNMINSNDNITFVFNGAKLIIKNRNQECCIQFDRLIKVFKFNDNDKEPFTWRKQSDLEQVGFNPQREEVLAAYIEKFELDNAKFRRRAEEFEKNYKEPSSQNRNILDRQRNDWKRRYEELAEIQDQINCLFKFMLGLGGLSIVLALLVDHYF